MSHGMAFYVLLVVQITFLTLTAGIAFLAVAGRRAEFSRRFLALTILSVLGVSVAAALPLPASWSLKPWAQEAVPSRSHHAGWRRDWPDRQEQTQVALVSWATVANAASTAARLLDTVHLAAGESPTWTGGWAVPVTALLAAGGVLVCIRRTGGLWSTYRLIRRSTKADDAWLLETAEMIRRSIGCRRVDLRVSKEMTGAGTVGWRRPFLILGMDWRDWSEGELRAVLAHEMAHIRSNDYLMGLAARLCKTLYFYHPLVRWLASRFFLAQEMAADAMAARLVGGRADYLVALSRIALRQDQQSRSAPVLAFASSSSTLLMRRIEMLEFMDDRSSPRMRFLQRTALGFLCAGALAATALRVPAQEESETAVPQMREPARELTPLEVAALVRKASTSDEVRPPIDLRYVGDWDGFVAVRPSAVFAHPEIAAGLSQDNGPLSEFFQDLSLPEGARRSLADLEQTIGPITIRTNPEAPQGQRHTVTFGLSMFRTTKPYPWKEILLALDPNTKELQRDEIRVLETSKPLFPGIGPVTGLALPDSRTILPYAAAGTGVPKPARQAPPHSAAWADDWSQVQQSAFALVLDNRNGQWSQGVVGNTESERLAHPEQLNQDEYVGIFATHMRYTVFGVDWQGASLSVRMIIQLQSPEAAKHIMAGMPERLAQMRTTVTNQRPEGSGPQAVLGILSTELLDQTRLEQTGSKICIRSTATLTSDQIAACL